MMRWSRNASGKSGDVRVIYYYHNESMPLYLLTLFSKKKKAYISLEEKKLLAKLVNKLVAFWSP